MSNEQSFDYIVVGGGASGLVLVNRLSADPNNRVLLLEAGPMDDNPAIHTRDYATGFTRVWGTDLDWQFMTEPQPSLNGRQIFTTQGKVIGGSGSVHAMMYVRGDKMDYDGWNYLGCDNWSYEDVLPYFKRAEDYEEGADEIHGAGGPMKSMKCPNLTAAAQAFLKAGAEIGFRGGAEVDLNAVDRADAAGIMQFNFTADGKRWSTADGYLRPIMERPNLTVQTDARATRIWFENGRAAGVEYVRNGAIERVRAEREVIVSGGAFFSPQLLMLSGIGPAGHLREHGIEVVADLPGVGQNLQDHLRLIVAYNAKQDLPLPTSVAETGLFTRSRAGISKAPPDLQINFCAGVPGFVAPEYPVNGPHSIFVPILAQPVSRGEVRLKSSDPLAKPLINPNYLGCDTDLRAYVKGVEIVREMANSQAFAEFNAGEICPGPGADVAEYIRNNATTIWHPAGSCKMGVDSMAVVDPQLRVRGVEGLRVADASIMPLVTSGNTHAPCVMIGEKASAMVLGEA